MNQQHMAPRGTKKVSVTVTEFTLRGKKVWRLRRRINGKIERRFFETWGEAELARQQTIEQLEARGTESFAQTERLTVTQGKKKTNFEKVSVSLPPEVHEWIKAEAARRADRFGEHWSASRIVQEALREYRTRAAPMGHKPWQAF